jgi:hypothetical protein
MDKYFDDDLSFVVNSHLNSHFYCSGGERLPAKYEYREPLDRPTEPKSLAKRLQ